MRLQVSSIFSCFRSMDSIYTLFPIFSIICRFELNVSSKEGPFYGRNGFSKYSSRSMPMTITLLKFFKVSRINLKVYESQYYRSSIHKIVVRG
jgi:hypothetical protein